MISYDPYSKNFVETTERGVGPHYRRDVLCRLTEVRRIHSYQYDEWSRSIRLVQHPTGATSQVYDVYGRAAPVVVLSEREFEYDELDHLTRITSDATSTIECGYDAEGNLTSLTDVHGNVTEYTYYNDDRLREVIIKRDGQSDRVFTYSYDAAGRLSEIVYPTSTGIKAVFDDGATPTPNPGWNENGQLTHLRYLKKDGMGVYQHFHSFEYEYDPSGNRKKFIDTPENSANKITWEYGYDWLNRLTEVKRGDGAATPTTQRVYAYDESDNRTFLDDHVNNLSLHYTYDVADQILEIRQGTLSSRDTVNDFQTVVESFTHNEDGMMTQRVLDPNGTPVTTDYTWDEFDNLVEVDAPASTTVHSYDVDGIRKSKNGAEDVTFYSSGLISLAETISPADQVSFFSGHQVLGYEDDSGFIYFLTDGLSSVRSIVSASGVQLAEFVRSEFGERIADVGSNALTWLGALGVRDEETGLYYARHRYYDPTTGRFLSRDVLENLNRYAYGLNNPINWIDPSGLPAGGPEPSPSPGPKPGPDSSFRAFANMSNCCEAAERMGIDPAAVCAMAYHEFSYYNPKETAQATVVRFSLGYAQIGKNLGVVGMSPVFANQIAQKMAELESNPKLLPTSASQRSLRYAMLDPKRALNYFAALQRLRYENEGLRNTDDFVRRYNESNASWYLADWRNAKKKYLSAFSRVCDEPRTPCKDIGD